MSVEIRVFPRDDLTFQDRVRAATDGMAVDTRDDASQLARRDTRQLKDRYPRITTVVRDSIADLDGGLVVYVYRDGDLFSTPPSTSSEAVA